MSLEFNAREFAKIYRTLSKDDKKAFISSLSPEEAYLFSNLWEVQARPEQLSPEGDWRYWMIMAGRGYGKMIDVETPVPTPDGWLKMGELSVGDRVFDENGNVCCVTEVFPIETPEIAYRIYFSDGSVIDACSEHLWITWTHADRKQYLRKHKPAQFPEDWVNWKEKRQKTDRNEEAFFGPKVRTTQEILDSLTHGKRGDLNHCIPQCRPLKLPEVDLPIPPYLYGLWLADGNSYGGYIDKHRDDLPFLRNRIEQEGFETRSTSDPDRFHIVGLTKLLRQNNLLKNKHVLPIYLRASYEQRLALLQGLLDGDGYVGENNYCEFTNTNPSISNAVYELLMSMGIRATRAKKILTLNGRPCTEVELLKFVPTFNVFSLPRKANRLRFDRGQSLRRYYRMITKIEPIEPKPMRCISVDSPNNMYLVGESMIPTHNTRCIVEWAHHKAMSMPGSIGVMVATIASDVRDVLLEGPSGILNVVPDYEKPHYSPTKASLTWENGSRALLRSADKPDGLRGLNSHWAICDEFASWRRPDSINQLLLGLRLGNKPQLALATTPKPVRHLRDFLNRKGLVLTTGTSYDNRENLSEEWFNEIINAYEGTELGRQEILGQLLDDKKGALWSEKLIEPYRVTETPELSRIVIGVDPAMSSSSTSNWTGIVVAGVDRNNHYYVLDDLTIKGTPSEWGYAVVKAFHEYQADRIIPEKNNGGDLVENNIRTIDPNVPITPVVAKRGKYRRAEPIVGLYELGKVHHVGVFPMLETEMTTWVEGDESPDRMDSLVYALHSLAFGEDNQAPVMRRAVAKFQHNIHW